LYTNPGATTYFPVIQPPTYSTAQPDEIDPRTKAFIDDVHRQVAEDVSAISLNPKNIDVWVKKARWDVLRERPGFGTLAESLQEINPDDHAYFALPIVAAKVMKHVNSFIRGASLYFLRGMGNNLSSEAADIFVNCWRPINESNKAYSDTMALLIYTVIAALDSDEWVDVLGLFDFQMESARRLKEHLDVVAEDIIRNRKIGIQTEQLFWALAIDLFTYSGDAYKQLDLAIYRPGYEHPEPRTNPDLFLSIHAVVNSTRRVICGRYNPITNDDIIWRGMHRFLEDGKPVPMGALFALYGLLSGTSDGFTKGPIIFWTPNSNYGEMMYRNMTR
ncbi:hypothetical protein H4S02_007622, partial [Coemansia sp. RSA 2611]